ncbi:uncharacterized protein LOC130590834 [Beta vulgaris subsp. vulgaris]|uniref:uncharacterized protein LOC130590834 n=1 Tax=Beta vulgaris subsp. vulgaris TaxID=3555 RepID=UPI002546BABA|nr:uncharacterized protein LOC130590834 [Beta vulgaris subsp. vulgaris]
MGSTSTGLSNRVLPKICKCKIGVATLTSWTSDNPGRKFITCKFYDRIRKIRHGCDVWEWVDEHQEEWQRVLINQLLLEKKLLGSDIEVLKAEVHKLEQQRMKLAKENERLVKKLKAGSREKRGSESGRINIFYGICLFCFL